MSFGIRWGYWLHIKKWTEQLDDVLPASHAIQDGKPKTHVYFLKVFYIWHFLA